MKIDFYIATVTSALSLVLTTTVLIVGYGNQRLQTEIRGQQKDLQTRQQELQKQQELINTAIQIQQKIGPALLQDMGAVSFKNNAMKELLAKHGYTVQLPAATPAPGGAAASAPTPSAFTPAEPALR